MTDGGRAFWIEKIAKLIAFWHGQKVIVGNRDGKQTVASLSGYGRFGDAPEYYMHDHWQEYNSAAESVIIELTKGWRPISQPPVSHTGASVRVLGILATGNHVFAQYTPYVEAASVWICEGFGWATKPLYWQPLEPLPEPDEYLIEDRAVNPPLT